MFLREITTIKRTTSHPDQPITQALHHSTHTQQQPRNAGQITRDPRWEEKRKELAGLIEQTIRRGNADATFHDPNPRITATCVPGLVRSVMLFGARGLDEKTVTAQITRLVERGVCGGEDETQGRKNGGRNVAVATGRNGR